MRKSKRSFAATASTVAMATAALGGASAASAQSLYSTGFEQPTFNTGKLASAIFSPGQDGWLIDDSTTSLNSYQIVSGSVGTGTTRGGTQSLRIDASPGTGYAFVPLNAVVGATTKINVDLSMRLGDSSTKSSSWGLTVFDLDATNIIAQFFVTANGQFFAQDGNQGFGASAAGTIARDTWYDYSMRFDFTTGTYRVLVNGAPLTLAIGGSAIDPDLGIRAGNGFIGDADIQNSPGTGTPNDFALVDNYSVTIVPEPVSFGIVALGMLARRRRTR